MADVISRLNAALSGRYVIESEIGSGGMATVYLAEDVRHRRQVALKVLRPELAAVVGAERFLAEIETTANLQHPHILPLYDSGEADSFLFYVMPYVEGETLRERLDREKQLPVEEALRIATAVAGALDYAHRHGVVHRDVKPGNILMQDGQPVMGDFGIALAVGAAGGTRLTETGLSVGTPYYMSPEQATGDQSVGPPSDIYALAAVLYELLTGEPPYMGTTAQAVLGKIIQGQPVSATAVRRAVPAHVDAALRKALEKLPADRFTSAQDFARALGDPAFRHGEAVGSGAPGSSWNSLSRGLAVACGVLALAAGWAWLRMPEPAATGVARYQLSTDVGTTARVPTEWLSLSGDAREMVMSYPDSSGNWRLWLRRWSDLTAAPLPGVAEEGGQAPSDPVLSADGSEVAFFVEGTLQVAPLAGGLVRTLATDANCCARWGDDGFIYFSNTDRDIQRVPVSGGTVEDVVKRGPDEPPFAYFQILPGGDAGVFTVHTTPPHLEAVRLSTGERTVLTPGLRSYVTSTGHLVFATLQGQLLAAPFDAKKLQLTGAPVPMIEGVGIRGTDAMYALSENGTLLYWQTSAQSQRGRFVWVDSTGRSTEAGDDLTFDPGTANAGWSLAPDGHRVAYRDMAGGNGDIWVADLNRGTRSRLTFDEAADWSPRWNAAGDTVYFLSDRTHPGTRTVWAKRADGVGEAREVARTDRSISQIELSPDGSWLVLRATSPPSFDILALRPGTDSVAAPLVASPDYSETAPALSPDGRWLAYQSDETGSPQVYVRPFPDVDAGRWQISSDAAIGPRWSRDGTRLFFFSQTGEHVADVDGTDGFHVLGTRRVGGPEIFTGTVLSATGGGWYDVASDGRILMAKQVASQGQTAKPALILVQNFLDDVKARVPR